MSGHDCKNAPSSDFGVTNKFSRQIHKYGVADNEEQMYLGRVKVVVLVPGKRGSKALSASLGLCLFSFNLCGW